MKENIHMRGEAMLTSRQPVPGIFDGEQARKAMCVP
jgi:hypothetical protein